jgi:epoxyqueuosine reductase
METTYTQQTKDKILALGADLVGVADVGPLKALRTDPGDLLEPFTRAVAIAVQLPAAVFEMITDRPTALYAEVYLTANRLLDEIALRTATLMQRDGYLSLPIPASLVTDKIHFHANISHKAVARVAGLGWQGKNLLLITPQYGSRVRLVTVLTTAPLDIDGPIKNRCGNCMACRDACPVGAIKGISTTDHYQSRDEALYFSRCADKLTKDFAQRPEIARPICGICINACPYGKKIKEKRHDR